MSAYKMHLYFSVSYPRFGPFLWTAPYISVSRPRFGPFSWMTHYINSTCITNAAQIYQRLFCGDLERDIFVTRRLSGIHKILVSPLYPKNRGLATLVFALH